MKNTIRIFVIFSLLLSSCYNKDLCPDCEIQEGLSIKFDWSKVAPQPLMTTLVYNAKGELVKKYQVPEGGKDISLLPGKYTIVTYNSSSDSQWSGENSLNTLHVTSPDGDQAGEKASSTYVCGATKRDVVVKNESGTEQVISLTPTEITDHYTYQISGLSSLGDKVTINSVSLSGLNDGYSPNGNSSVVHTCTVPFDDNDYDPQTGSLSGHMTCFGPHPGEKDNVTISITYDGKQVKIPVQNVTEQISSSTDPHNVIIHIVLDIVDIDFDVDDWDPQDPTDIIL